MWELLHQVGQLPRRLIWNNESGVGRGKRHIGVAAFAGTLATTLQRLKPRDPASNGIVERRNGFYDTSFMPGGTSRHRPISGPAQSLADHHERPDRAVHQAGPGRSGRRRCGAMPSLPPRCAGLREL